MSSYRIEKSSNKSNKVIFSCNENSLYTKAKRQNSVWTFSLYSHAKYFSNGIQMQTTHAYNMYKKLNPYPGLLAEGRLYFLTAFSVWWRKNINCIENRHAQTHTCLSSEVSSLTHYHLSQRDLKSTVCATSYRRHASPRNASHCIQYIQGASVFMVYKWIQMFVVNAMLMFTLMQGINCCAIHRFHA